LPILRGIDRGGVRDQTRVSRCMEGLVRTGKLAWSTGGNREGANGVFGEEGERKSGGMCMVIVRVPRNDREDCRGVVEVGK